MVEKGIMTMNEARQALGYYPVTNAELDRIDGIDMKKRKLNDTPRRTQGEIENLRLDVTDKRQGQRKRYTFTPKLVDGKWKGKQNRQPLKTREEARELGKRFLAGDVVIDEYGEVIKVVPTLPEQVVVEGEFDTDDKGFQFRSKTAQGETQSKGSTKRPSTPEGEPDTDTLDRQIDI